MPSPNVRLRFSVCISTLLLGVGCSGPTTGTDAGTDAIASRDAATDASIAADAGTDASIAVDVRTDAIAASDAGTDAVASPDVATDTIAPSDVGTDAVSTDAGSDSGSTAIAWAPCGPFECGTLQVPVDYAQPGGPTLGIALSRRRASLPDRRIGTVVFNPGGPGVDGVSMLPGLVSQLTPAAGELLLRFDILVFDWRGTGLSQQIRCVDDATMDQIREVNTVQPDTSGITEQTARQYLSGCTSRNDATLLAHLDSASAARDLERLRIALGEDRLNYLGVSYGTRLGATYATLFPDRVRAFVLDSNTAPVAERLADMLDGATLREQELNDFFARCDADATCPLHTSAIGGSAATVDTLLAQLATTPLQVGTRHLHDGDAVEAILNSVGEPDRGPLATALAAAIQGDGTALLGITDFYIHRNSDGTYTPFYQPHLAISAADLPFATGYSHTDFDAFTQNTLIPAAPRAGTWIAHMLPSDIALDWPYQGTSPVPAASAVNAVPMLLVNGRADGVTPLANARAMQSALGNGSYLLESDTPGHVQMVRSACVRAREAAFIVDPSAAPDLTPCAVEPPAPDETVLGTVTQTFTRTTSDALRQQEEPLGDLVADAIRESAGTQLAVINGGGIRAALPSNFLPMNTALRRPDPGYAAGPPYDIVVSDVNRALPFHNRVATMQITGAQLYALLESSVSQLPLGGSNFLQVSGFRFTYSAAATAGSRVRSVALADGTSVAADATRYTLALPDFIYYGGTGYPALADGTAVVHEELSIALGAYIRAHSPVAAATDGRITALP